MELSVTWKSYPLSDDTKRGMTYTTELKKIPDIAGVYFFARQHGKTFEALYVGKANNLRSRIKTQLNNLLVMNHVQDSAQGPRAVYVGVFNPKPNHKRDVCLRLIEKALIRYFVSERHDLVNRQGKTLKQHTINSSGSFDRSTMSAKISVEK